MIDDELLELLACPATHQPLLRADDALLGELNAAIQSGSLKNVGGEAVEEQLEAALVREDRSIAYPIVDGIPVLLVDEGLSCPSSGA